MVNLKIRKKCYAGQFFFKGYISPINILLLNNGNVNGTDGISIDCQQFATPTEFEDPSGQYNGKAFPGL